MKSSRCKKNIGRHASSTAPVSCVSAELEEYTASLLTEAIHHQSLDKHKTLVIIQFLDITSLIEPKKLT